MTSDQLQNRLRALAELESAQVMEIVRRALVSPSFTIGAWDVEQLSSAGAINPEGLFLFSGDGHDEHGQKSWSFVLKMLQSRTPEPDPSNAWHWKREYWVMESGLLETLPGPLVPPRCYGVEIQSDGAWIWMEHILDQSPRRWKTEEFVFAAEQLGLTTGNWLDSGIKIDYPWLSRGIAKTWSEGFGPTEERWSNEHVNRVWSETLKKRLMAVWVERERLYTALEHLPQTFAHFDSQRRNLMIRARPDGKDELVAVDWAWCGIGPIGADAAILIGNSMILFEADPKMGEQLEEAIFQSYLDGLRATGWNGNSDEVRLAYTASNALFCGVTAPWRLSVLRHKDAPTYAHCVQMSAFGIEQGEEALRLIDHYF